MGLYAVFGVKVFGCSSVAPVSGMIAGADFVLANAQKPAVALLPFVTDASSNLDAAVNKRALTYPAVVSRSASDRRRYEYRPGPWPPQTH
eukprot:tig00000133_g7676.t1